MAKVQPLRQTAAMNSLLTLAITTLEHISRFALYASIKLEATAMKLAAIRYNTARRSRNRTLPLLHAVEERVGERRCPSPRSSPRSCVAGRGRRKRSCRKSSRLATIWTDTDRRFTCRGKKCGEAKVPGRVVGLCALNFFPPDAGAAGEGVSSAPPSQFIIGISPFLDKSVKDEVYRGIVRLVVEDLPLNSALAVYDAYELKTITQLSLPDARAFNSPKTRANQFAPAIRDLKLFLAQESHKPTNSHPSFEAAIRLPQFL